MSNRLIEPNPEGPGYTHEFDDGPPAAQYERLAQIDRHFLEQLDRLPPIGTLSVEEERARMQAGQTKTIDEYPVEVQEVKTPGCAVHLISPLGARSPAPILFFIHGGGWALGDLSTHTEIVCELALRTQSVVAFIDYPRAPENPFPAPLEACVTAVSSVLDQAESLQLDRSRFAIGGDSSGGNLCAAVVLSAIERGLPLPACQILLYPVTNHDWTTDSYRQFATNPNLSQFTMEWFWQNYLSEQALGAQPRVSPLRAADQLLAQFPPTLIVTCEYDVLRDEGEKFAARLIAAGVNVAAVRWLGALHGFLVTESLASSVSARICIDMIAQYILRGFGESSASSAQ